MPDAGVTDVDLREPRGPVRLDATLPARLVGLPYTRQDVVDTLREIGCDVDDPGEGEDLLVLPPSLASRPAATAPTSPRRSPACAATTRSPPCCPRRPGGRGLTHDQRVRRVVADTLAGQGLHEVLTYPFVGGQGRTTSSGWRPTTRGATRCGWPTRCPRRRR